MTIETKKLVISEELRKKVDMICRFASIKYEIVNGSIISFKNTNIAHIEPHSLKINEITYLFFNECEDVYINNLNRSIPLKELEGFIKCTF